MTLQWTIENSVGRLVMNQPPSNTMTIAFFRDLGRLLEELTARPEKPRAIIISGSGRHFSSGADIGELLNLADEGTLQANSRTFLMLEQLNIPVIAAIRGVCLGSALELALFCHFRICSDDAVFGLPESTYNLMPGIGGTAKVSALAGKAKALEIVLRGNTFPASDALDTGLVDAIVPKKKLMDFAEDFALAIPGGYDGTGRQVCIHKYLKPLHVTL